MECRECERYKLLMKLSTLSDHDKARLRNEYLCHKIQHDRPWEKVAEIIRDAREHDKTPHR